MRRISAGLRTKARGIALLLLDVDGVLTDGRITIDDHGRETKSFHVRDGQGIVLLLRAGIDVGFVTARVSGSVRRRAKELGVTLLHQGVADKLAVYQSIKQERRLRDAQIAFMGDDIADLAVLSKSGLAFSVADGCPEARATAVYVTQARGGKGAVREVAEILLQAQGKWRRLLSEYKSK